MNKNDLLKILAKMSLEQKIGQCLTFGFSGSVITDDCIEAMEHFHCGGLRLSPYSNNFEYKIKPSSKQSEAKYDFSLAREKMIPISTGPYFTPEQYTSLLDKLQKMGKEFNCGIPLHTSVDQEGDLAADIVKGGVALFPSQKGLCAINDLVLVEKAAAAIADQLIHYGVNMIHGPVLDVNVRNDNVEIDTRSFSPDPNVCAEYGLAMMRGFQSRGVIATGKHFPGRGNSNLDAHVDVPVIEGTLKDFESCELIPFRRLVENGVDAIMLAHTIYPGLDPSGMMSTVSPTIVNILRKQLGFKGVITTDSITMAALVDKYGAADGSAMALQAGCDLILLKEESKLRADVFFTIKDYVVKKLISLEQLDESVFRILTMKNNRRIFDQAPATPETSLFFPNLEYKKLAEDVSRKAMIIKKNKDSILPLDKKKSIYLIEHVLIDRSPNDYWNHPRKFYELLIKNDYNIKYRTEIACYDHAMNETKPHDMKELLKYNHNDDFDLLIITSTFSRSFHTEKKLIEDIINQVCKPVLVITNTPYDSGYIEDASNIIINFNTTPDGYRALIDIFSTG